MKKLVALALACCVVSTLSAPAFAETKHETKHETKTKKTHHMKIHQANKHHNLKIKAMPKTGMGGASEQE